MLTLSVCLVEWILGRIEKKSGKLGEKMSGNGVWLRGGGRAKSGGAHKFSLLPFQNTISSNWRENWSEKWEKYLDKTTPTSFLCFWLFFFFFLVFLYNVGFFFLFFFSFFFLWFCQAVGSSSFPSFFFFFLNFIFIIFLKKTLLNDFLFYFLKCPLSDRKSVV